MYVPYVASCLVCPEYNGGQADCQNSPFLEGQRLSRPPCAGDRIIRAIYRYKPSKIRSLNTTFSLFSYAILKNWNPVLNQGASPMMEARTPSALDDFFFDLRGYLVLKQAVEPELLDDLNA